ncbi:PREDICTED: splicing factor, proline- and glutamine-rich-like [Myotis brandtii]|uniref:splicing factor, proline- and glutamine-rich-like n=1 Tax=Myotis brandtii TaxID=109478 RepID=UPI0007042B1E|nr:PREDICTED: splicing factor, proline- and glutamine-rich-like [Myotis brandtii]
MPTTVLASAAGVWGRKPFPPHWRDRGGGAGTLPGAGALSRGQLLQGVPTPPPHPSRGTEAGNPGGPSQTPRPFRKSFPSFPGESGPVSPKDTQLQEMGTRRPPGHQDHLSLLPPRPPTQVLSRPRPHAGEQTPCCLGPVSGVLAFSRSQHPSWLESSHRALRSRHPSSGPEGAVPPAQPPGQEALERSPSWDVWRWPRQPQAVCPELSRRGVSDPGRGEGPLSCRHPGGGSHRNLD